MWPWILGRSLVCLRVAIDPFSVFILEVPALGEPVRNRAHEQQLHLTQVPVLIQRTRNAQLLELRLVAACSRLQGLLAGRLHDLARRFVHLRLGLLIVLALDLWFGLLDQGGWLLDVVKQRRCIWILLHLGRLVLKLLLARLLLSGGQAVDHLEDEVDVEVLHAVVDAVVLEQVGQSGSTEGRQRGRAIEEVGQHRSDLEANGLDALVSNHLDLWRFLELPFTLCKISLEFQHLEEVEELEQIREAALLDELEEGHALEFLLLDQGVELGDVVIDVRNIGEEGARVHVVLVGLEFLHDLANAVASDPLYDQLAVVEPIVVVVAASPQVLVDRAQEAANMLPLVVQEGQVLPIHVEVVFGSAPVAVELVLVLEADVFLEVDVELFVLRLRDHAHLDELLLVLEELDGVAEAALGDRREEGLQGLHLDIPLACSEGLLRLAPRQLECMAVLAYDEGTGRQGASQVLGVDRSDGARVLDRFGIAGIALVQSLVEIDHLEVAGDGSTTRLILALLPVDLAHDLAQVLECSLELLLEDLDHIGLSVVSLVDGDSDDLAKASEETELPSLRHVLRELVRWLDCGQYLVQLEEGLAALSVHHLVEQGHQRASIVVRWQEDLLQLVHLKLDEEVVVLVRQLLGDGQEELPVACWVGVLLLGSHYDLEHSLVVFLLEAERCLLRLCDNGLHSCDRLVEEVVIGVAHQILVRSNRTFAMSLAHC